MGRPTSVGAVCGWLAGAYWGECGIPQEWLDGLARSDMNERGLAGLVADGGAAIGPGM